MIKFLKNNWLLVLILLLASIFRLYRIGDYMEFLGDQGRDVVYVRNLLRNGDLIFIGPQTSIGNMYLGPYYYYLIAPSLFLAGFNPIGPAIFIALLGVATVWLLFRIGKKWFNTNIAYLSAFLFAISPVVIKYSDFSWNPNIMPFFSLLFIYFMMESRYLYAVLAFIMALNSHYLALILLPLAGLIWIYHYLKNPSKRLLYIKQTILAALVFIVSLTPQFLFDYKHQGQLSQAFIEFFTHRETTVNLKAYKSLPLIPLLFNQINTRLLAGKDPTLGIIVSLILTMALFWVLYLRLRKSNSRVININLLLVVLWFFIGLVGLGLYKQHIYDHYFGFLFPAVFLLAGVIIYLLGRYLGSLLFVALVVFSLLQNPFRWQPPSQLRTTKTITDSINQAAKGQPFNFSLLAKTNYDPGYKYFFYEAHSPLYTLDERVTDQLFVVCEPHPEINCNPINNPEWSVAAFGWAQIDSQWETNGIKIFKLTHPQANAKKN